MVRDTRPLYSQVKEVIEDRIESRDWLADFKIPSEDDLSVEFDVSRLTVRRALRELQAEGILLRIRGRGTFVVGPRMQCAIFGLEDVAEEIAANGSVHSCDVVALCELDRDSPQMKLSPLGEGDRVFYSRILHLEDGSPIQIEDRFINAELAPGYLDQDFTAISSHTYLLRETKVTFVENTIRAIRPDPEAQGLLQVDERHPCLLINRRTWHNDLPVTRSRFLYPGDRYRLTSAHEASTGAVPKPRNPRKAGQPRSMT